jgi:hypothetical protein
MPFLLKPLAVGRAGGFDGRGPNARVAGYPSLQLAQRLQLVRGGGRNARAAGCPSLRSHPLNGQEERRRVATPARRRHRLHDAGDVQHSERVNRAGTRAARLHRPEGMDVKAYAENAGRAKEQQTVYREVWAAEVASAVNNVVNGDLSGHYIKLVEIHAAPAWLWPALVAAMLPSTRPMGEVLVDPGLGQARCCVYRGFRNPGRSWPSRRRW